MTPRPVRILATELRLAMLKAGFDPSFISVSPNGKRPSLTLKGGEYHNYTTDELRFMADWLDAHAKKGDRKRPK